MNSQIEKVVQKFSTCAKYATSKRKELLLTPPLPICTDLFTTHNETYIIITDYYSLWPELYQLKRTKTHDVIEVMKDVFARHGIPDEVYSDNDPQYKAKSFKDFSKEWGFIHTTSSPQYPQSNGLAEALVKILKQMINKCINSGQDIKASLLAIRNTPLKCGSSPAQLLLGRPLREHLPALPDNKCRQHRQTHQKLTDREKTTKASTRPTCCKKQHPQ